MNRRTDMSQQIWQQCIRIARRLRDRVTTPRVKSVLSLSDAEFLDKFNLVKKRRNDLSGNTGEQIKALFNHYRERFKTGWPSAPNTISDMKITIDEICDLKLDQMSASELIAQADSILKYQFSDGGISPKILASGKIDWHFSPTSNPEWLWWLHRHHWWPVLAVTYARTGDERYAESFVSQMKDWIQSNPMPTTKDETSPSWRLMEVALRMRVCWIPAFALFFESPAFTDHDKLMMLRSIYDHATFLSTFKSSRNHLLRETNGLVHIAVYFPEFKMAKRWQRKAISRIEQELINQVNRDGTHIEMSVGYQWLVVDEFEKAYRLLVDCNLSLPNQNLAKRLEAMYQVLAYVVRPDGTFPQINDGFIHWDCSRLKEAGTQFARDDFIFIGSSGNQGQAPSLDSIGFKDAGLYVMRSDWTSQSHYLLFDTGPYGGYHGHEDKLSVEIAAYGTPFIVDSGSYTYDAKDPFRSYFVESKSHNTVLVDNASQIRRWNTFHMNPKPAERNDAVWITGPRFDYAAAAYEDGYGEFSLTVCNEKKIIDDVIHTRRVLFLKPDYWIILDELAASKEHDYQLLFHLHPDIRARIVAEKTVRLESASENILQIIPVFPEGLKVTTVAGSENPIQGWYSNGPYQKQPAQTVIYEKKTSNSTCLVTIIYPCQNYSAEENIQVQPLKITAGEGAAFVFCHQHGADTIMFSPTRELKTFGEFDSVAQLVAVRANHQGDILERFEV